MCIFKNRSLQTAMQHSYAISHPLTDYENFHFLTLSPVLDTITVRIVSKSETTIYFFELICNICKIFFSKHRQPSSSFNPPLQVMVFRPVTSSACLLELLQSIIVALKTYFQEPIMMVQLCLDLTCVQNRTITYLLPIWQILISVSHSSH